MAFPSEKILVTGADGLLGSNLVRELLARQDEVRVFLQPNRQVDTLEGLPLERVYGDIREPVDVLQAMQGCQSVVHVAALTDVWPSRGPKYWSINLEGTRQVVAAALKTGIRRLVHVGSAASFLYGSKEIPGTEARLNLRSPYGLDYIDSKTAAQTLVLEAVKEKGLPAVVVNPTFMIGPYDSKPSSGAMLLAVYRQQVPAFSPGGKNWAAVKDVAIGTANALHLGRLGECYIMGGQNLSYREAMTIIAETLGVPAPRLTMPAFAVKAAGVLGSGLSTLTQSPPKVSYAMARVACDGHYFSPAKAQAELALPQTPLSVAVEEAMSWFKAHGYV